MGTWVGIPLPHTVILDKASSATAPPRNGTRASRLDSATSSALYEPTRLALSGTTRCRPIVGKSPEATILAFLHCAASTNHCPCGNPHPAASVLSQASRHLKAKTRRWETFPVPCPGQTPASTTRPCRGVHGLMTLNFGSESRGLPRGAARLDGWSPVGLAVNQDPRPLLSLRRLDDPSKAKRR